VIRVNAEQFRLEQPFIIARGARTHASVLTVEIERDGMVGRGECVPYARYGETLESVQAEIQQLPVDITREALQSALPAGAARNAVDCALWDLEAQVAGKPVWALAGLDEPGSVETAFTLSLEPPADMHRAAEAAAARPLLKIKLGGGAEDVDRIRAVRAGAPDATLIIDANEGWSVQEYQTLAPIFVDLGVAMVEQPLPAADDAALADIERPLPVCADEAAHDRASLAGLVGKYDMVNIKLDKTGGLTEALAMRREAAAQGYQIMVGCMVGSSLAMAPATLIAQGAEIVDLDAPLLLAEDRIPPIPYTGSTMHPTPAALWGGGPR
jgi:L-alanine-DL-glutamate epimerase-like enolase superfamily enzyme